MSKLNSVTIKGEVSTQNDFCEAQSFCVEVSPETIGRILKLASIVLAEDLNSLALFDYSVNWLTTDLDEDSALDEDLYQVETPELVATADSFYWTALPESGTDQNRISTPEISIASVEQAALLPDTIVIV